MHTTWIETSPCNFFLPHCRKLLLVGFTFLTCGYGKLDSKVIIFRRCFAFYLRISIQQMKIHRQQRRPYWATRVSPVNFLRSQTICKKKFMVRGSGCIVALFTFDYRGELKAPTRKLHTVPNGETVNYARHTNQEATCKFQRPGDTHKDPRQPLHCSSVVVWNLINNEENTYRSSRIQYTIWQ